MRRYVYDSQGNLKEKRSNGKRLVSYAYDKTGKIREIRDPAGVSTCYEYDILGRVSRIHSAGGMEVSYGYDSLDRIIGRFLQEDVYQNDGLNLYAYCRNNPVVYYDPSGYECYYSDKFAEDSDSGFKGKSKNQIPDESKEKWGRGTFPSVEESLKYHMKEHGASVEATDIDNYVRKAEGFSQNLRGAKKSYPTEGTPGCSTIY